MDTQNIQQAVADAAAAGWVVALHVLGAIVFVGSSIAVAKLLGTLSKTDVPVRSAAAVMARKVYRMVTFPAALLFLAGGIYMLVVDPREKGYLHLSWFHMKLAVAALLLIVDHMFVLRPLRNLVKGAADPAHHTALYRSGFPLMFLLALAMTATLFVVRK